MNKFISLLLLPTMLILLFPKPVKADILVRPKYVGTFLALNACVQTVKKAMSSAGGIIPSPALTRTSDNFTWIIHYDGSLGFIIISCEKVKKTNKTKLSMAAGSIGLDKSRDRLVSSNYSYLYDEIKRITGQS